MRPAHERPKVLCVAFDGIMAHMEDAMLEAVRAACASLRLTVQPDRLTVGFPIRPLLRTLAHEQYAEVTPPEIERAAAIFETRYASGISERGSSLLDAQILALVKMFRAQVTQTKVVLVSPHIQDLTATAAALGIAMSFDAIVGAPEKSGASAYAHVAAKFRAQAADCVGIARYPYDIACMRDIGMCAVGIKTDIRSSELLGSAGAWRVFISPQDMSIFKLVDVFRTGPPTQSARDKRAAAFLIKPGDGTKDDA